MTDSDLRGAYHRLTLATSDQYPHIERILCLREFFGELAKEEQLLSKDELTEIIELVQATLTKHVNEIMKNKER